MLTYLRVVIRCLGVELFCRHLGIVYAEMLRVGIVNYNFSAQQKKKIKFLYEAVDVLQGGYNYDGIKKWFSKKRKALDGKSPDDILNNGWAPTDELPQKILALAKNLRDGNAT